MYYDPILNIGVLACSRQGSSHKRDTPPTPCQDSFQFCSGSIAGQHYLIAAVADGHGSKKYERSAVGSYLAVQSAIDIFRGCLLNLRTADGSIRKSDELIPLTKQFSDDFARQVVRKWRDEIKKHLECFPHPSFTKHSQPEMAKSMYELYGTTLLFAAVTENDILLAKMGDGDIVILSKEGSPVVPFTEPPELVGGTTESLCSINAENKFQIDVKPIVHRSKIRAITLSTDGVSNACGEDDQNFYNLLGVLMEEKNEKSIPKILDNFSLNGSGDDMTFLGLCFGKTITLQSTPPVEQPEVLQPVAGDFGVDEVQKRVPFSR